MSFALEVRNVNKSFRHYGSEWKRVLSWFGFPFRAIDEQGILSKINFSVKTGESVGVVGQNGAGKSTLLKIITGTLKPTKGSVVIQGRIAAILELGMGFHPDLTGRQNAYHSAGLMGFSRESIDTIMGDIEDFADIPGYFDQPVRVYSSGMQVRVAFAVATAIRPDILIIDEALSVGDASFQRKCFRRIELFQKEGTALLFVSHDIETVKKICSKAIYIKSGTIEAIGSAKNICDMYEKSSYGFNEDLDESKKVNTNMAVFEDSEINYGDGRANITKVWLENDSGSNIKIVESGMNFSLNFAVEFFEHIEDIGYSMMIKTREGIAVFGTDSMYLGKKFSANIDKNRISFFISNYLAPGTYYVNCGVFQKKEGDKIFLHRRIDTLIFKVIQSDKTTTGSGIVDLSAKFNINSLQDA